MLKQRSKGTNRMDRLTLSSRPKTAEKEKCLPAGDGLPLWSEVPLFAKLPVYPNPRGSYKLCTTSLCEPKHKTTHFDFDLTDPCGHFTFSEYEPLHDPHLRNHFNVPRMRRHLVRNGFLHDGKVVCDLKEFNKYRQYLRKMFLLEMENERHEQQGLADSRRSHSNDLQDSYTYKRLRVVQNRMAEMMKLRRQQLKTNNENKSVRLQKRLNEMNAERSIKEARNKHLEKKRKRTLQQHRDMIEKRNQLLIRRWKMQERQRQRRLMEAKRKELSEHRQKIEESWETRKKNQWERLEREAEIMHRLEDEKNSNIVGRDKRTTAQRQSLQDQLEDIREKMKTRQELMERRHARRLAERLALADIRNMARRNARRRGRKPQFYSMWNIVSSLRRMEISDLKEQRSAKFLEMISDAYEEVVIFIDDTADYDDEWGGITDEEIVHLKARQIVMNVYDKVKMDHFDQTEDAEGHISFRGRTSVIPGYSDTNVKASHFKPVSDHIVTPIASTIELGALKLEEAKEEECRRLQDMKLAENLLLRLLNDLNKEKLEKEDILKLTGYCMEIVQKRDYKIAVDEDVEVGDLNEYQISGLADNLVKFTLESLITGIKKGELSHEELTKLTLSIIGSKSSQDRTDTESLLDNEIDQFVEDTLHEIVQDKELHVESPVNDTMLDEFIVTTLKTLADDVEHGRLPKEMIQDMLSLMTAEVNCQIQQEPSNTNFKTMLYKIIEDLEGEKGDSLYRVVHAFVSSYLNFKESSQDSLEELVNLVIERIRDEMNEDIEPLVKLAAEMSTQSLTTAQMSSIASDVIRVVSSPSLTTQVARCIVEEAIERAKAEILSADNNGLKQIASQLTSSIDNVLHAKQNEDDDKFPSFASNVSKFVTDVLKLVFRNLQKGYFTDIDIEEMMSCIQTVVQSRDDKLSILTNHIKSLITEMSLGISSVDNLEDIGRELIDCGRKLRSAVTRSETPSRTSTRTPSLTSTAIADDLVGHLLQSLKTEFHKGTVTKESLKEIAFCILRSTSSSISIASSGEQGYSSVSLPKKLSTVKYPSPCDSKIAEDVVRQTLGHIMKDIDDGKLYPGAMVSIASSVVSLFSDDDDRREAFNTLMHNVISRLREDRLTLREVRGLFNAILKKYQYDLSVLFPRDGPVSADSELAESLIRETVIKIDRDIRSGFLSDDDLQLFAEDSRRSFHKMTQEAPQDVVNLVISILKHLKMEIVTSDTSNEVLSFLKAIDTEHGDIIRTKAEVIQAFDRIISDITDNGHSSFYLKRILRHYVTHHGTDKDMMALGNILQTMNVGVLSNFVRFTVADVLSDIRRSRIQSATELTIDMSQSETGALIQTASSKIANKLVHNLLSRIEKTVLSGKTLDSDTELVHVSSESKDDHRHRPSFLSFENDLLEKISSTEIGAHILETLNNIISNMRLERSVDRFQDIAHEGFLDLHRRMSSNVIEDFVLETLQDIVENMQDQLSYSDMQDVSRLRQEASETSVFVMDVLKNILKDMSEEIRQEEQREQVSALSADKTTSTVSFEAEAVVVGALHNIVRDFVGADEAKRITMQSFKFDNACAKQQVIEALEGIKRDIHDPYNTTARIAVTNIVQSAVANDERSQESDPNLDNFIDNTINMIIDTLETNKLQANAPSKRGLSQSSLESEDSLEFVIVTTCDVDPVLMDGRTISLQKMAEMTSKMVKMYNDNIQSERSSRQDIIGSIPGDQVKAVLSETVSKTLDNVETGKLSEKEIHDLANALSEKFSLETIAEFDREVDVTRSSSTVDKAVENFVATTLGKVKEELSSSLTNERMKMVVKSMTSIHKDQENVSQTGSSLKSVSSEMLTQLVKKVLSNIVNSYSESEITIRDESRNNQGSDKSISSSLSSKSTGSSNRKANINPNAVKKRWSAKSDERIKKPLKATPTPIMHSYCDVTDLSPKVVEYYRRSTSITHNIGQRGSENKSKPMCMVTPQKTVEVKSTGQKKDNRAVATPNRLPSSGHVRVSNNNSRKQPTTGGRQRNNTNMQTNRNVSSRFQNGTTGRSLILSPIVQRPPLISNPTVKSTPTERRTLQTNFSSPSTLQTGKKSTKFSSPKNRQMEQKSMAAQNSRKKKSESLTPTNKRPIATIESNNRGKSPNSIKTPKSGKKITKSKLTESESHKVVTVSDKQSQQNKSPSAKEQSNTKPAASEPMEIRSLCGSHRTKISVRSCSENEHQPRKRPPFH